MLTRPVTILLRLVSGDDGKAVRGEEEEVLDIQSTLCIPAHPVGSSVDRCLEGALYSVHRFWGLR